MPDDDRSTRCGREVSLRIELLDAQVVDTDDLPVGRVDDVEIDVGDPHVPVVALLTGQRPLGERLGGAVGGLLSLTAHRTATDEDDARVGVEEVAGWGRGDGIIALRSPLSALRVAGLERWLSTHVVRRVPGADDAGV